MALLTVLGFSLSMFAAAFPTPKSMPDTPDLKSDKATIESVDSSKTEIRGRTAAGTVTYKVVPEVPIYGLDGNPAGSPAELKVGQAIRLYYVVDKGAIVREIDLL